MRKPTSKTKPNDRIVGSVLVILMHLDRHDNLRFVVSGLALAAPAGADVGRDVGPAFGNKLGLVAVELAPIAGRPAVVGCVA